MTAIGHGKPSADFVPDLQLQGTLSWQFKLSGGPRRTGTHDRIASFINQLLIGFMLNFVAASVAAQDGSNPATPAAQYQALLKDLQGTSAAYFQTTNDPERQAIVARVDKATVRLLELVEKNPKEPFALDALTQVITQEYWLDTYTSQPGWGKVSPQARAIALLLRDHLDSDKLGETCKRVNFGFRQECETFLRTVLDKNPHREVQGQAC